MLPEQQDRVVVVLVRARNPSNVGAVARAMHDFGFTHLRVVNEFPVPFQAALTAERAAVDASTVLEAASQHGTVAEAVADCTLVLGTTAVGDRVLEHPLHTLNDAAALAQNALASNQTANVALLFGSEKTGLSNDELSHCHALLTIPMSQMSPRSAAGAPRRHLSMNLGQAAAVCLYVLSQASTQPVTAPSEPQASSGDLERLTALLEEVLAQSGYSRAASRQLP